MIFRKPRATRYLFNIQGRWTQHIKVVFYFCDNLISTETSLVFANDISITCKDKSVSVGTKIDRLFKTGTLNAILVSIIMYQQCLGDSSCFRNKSIEGSLNGDKIFLLFQINFPYRFVSLIRMFPLSRTKNTLFFQQTVQVIEIFRRWNGFKEIFLTCLNSPLNPAFLFRCAGVQALGSNKLCSNK